MRSLPQYPVLSVAVGIFAVAWLVVPSAPQRPQPLRGTAPTAQTAIVIPPGWVGDSAIELAVGDLKAALKNVFSWSADVVADPFPQLPPYSFVLGAPGTPFVDRLRADGVIGPLDLTADGFRLIRLSYRGEPLTLILGGGYRGTAYGVFRLIELYRLDPESIRRPLDIRAEPKMTLRLVSSPTGENYPTPEEALRWGYNAVAVTQWPWLANYDGVDPAIYGGPDSEDRRWLDANRSRARAEIGRAKALHLQVVTMGDAVSLPRGAAAAFGEELGTRPETPLFCIDRPKVQQLYSYGLRDVLTSFPDIDIVMVRTGENYPAGPITGNTPAKAECGPGADDPVRMTRLIMELSYQQIVVAAGKRYIQRAWDIGDEGFHADPDVADRILNGFFARPGLLVSFKHTRTDFWRHNPLNPNLTKPYLDRMVEFQAAREYEGKGAFPNYLGGIVANGAPEAAGDSSLNRIASDGVRAIWVWAKGGGWNGPNLGSDIWLDANNYAMSKLAWDPKTSPRMLSTQWATLRFGPEAANHVVRALEMSEDVVLKAFYVTPFAHKQGAWAPNILWTRDDVIFGGDRVGAIYQRSKEPFEVAEAVGEKVIARRLAGQMLEQIQVAADRSVDPLLGQEALNTTRYGQVIVAVLTSYVSGLFEYYQWVEGGRNDNELRNAALEDLRRWQVSWRQFNDQILSLPGVASGYQDSGMVATATEALTDLESRR